jgi:hypothetical protein
MAKDKEERIRELLQPRETVIFQADMHPAIFFLPVMVGLLGACIVLLTSNEVLEGMPSAVFEIGSDWIYGAKETYLGYWMMMGSVVFTFRFHQERKNLIQIVTNQRVVQVAGAFFAEQHEIKLHHITEIRIKRGHIINRLLHRGDIIFTNKKNVKEKVVFKGASHPDDFVEHLRLAQERYNEALEVKERVEKERSKS